jgi:hypothetical protein
VSKAITRLEDLQPDPHNANRGTERGRAQLDTSVRRYGAGRSILADKDGVIIAGNKTLETAADLGLPIRAVHTTGGELIVVVRDDLSLATDPAARELAYADNRVAQVDLDFDPSILLADLDAGIDLSALWSDAEIQALLAAQPDADEWAGAFDALPDGERAGFQQMTFTVTDAQAELVQRALAQAKQGGSFVDTGNENSNGNALARVCETYVS